MSHFWREISKLQYIGEISCSYQIGTGQSVKFWLDTWHAKCHLSIKYPHVFALCTNPSLCVQEVLASKGAVVRFRRSLHGILLAEWHEILAIIHSYTLTTDPDSLLWKWDSKHQFTTVSLYNFLSFRGVQDTYALLWWDNIVPLKVQVFMWLIKIYKYLINGKLYLHVNFGLMIFFFLYSLVLGKCWPGN